MLDFEIKGDFDLGWLGTSTCICTGVIIQNLGIEAHVEMFQVKADLLGNFVDVTYQMETKALDALMQICLEDICGEDYDNKGKCH